MHVLFCAHCVLVAPVHAGDSILQRRGCESVSGGFLRRKVPVAFGFLRGSVGVEEADGVDLVALVHMSVGVGHLLEGVADEGGDDGEVGALVDEQGDIGVTKVVDLDSGHACRLCVDVEAASDGAVGEVSAVSAAEEELGGEPAVAFPEDVVVEGLLQREGEGDGAAFACLGGFDLEMGVGEGLF